MAITPSFVRVAPDSTGKYIDNVEVNTGLADVVQRQVTITGDPEDPDGRGRVLAAPPAADAYGVVVRSDDRGNYDSGRSLLVVAGGSGVVFGGGDSIFVKAIILMNQSNQLQSVVGLDGALNQYFNIELKPREVKPLPFYGCGFVDGVVLVPSSDNTVVAHITGSQNA